MVERLFELLFKYRPLLFEQGDFTFAAPGATYLVMVGVIVAAVVTALTYARVRGKSQPRDRLVLTGVRLAILGVLLFCLFRPILVLTTVVPQQNFLGILVDDSVSMQVADEDGASRRDFVAAALGGPESELYAALSERFVLRFFRFDASTDRVDGVGQLAFDGTRTHLGQALDRAREELTGVPLAGLVMVTDGADNAQTSLTDSLLPLQAASVPVFTVGLGREAFERDIQLSRVETPRTVLKGASVVVDLVVTQTGYAGVTVPLQVEDEGRIVTSESVTLAGNGQPATVRVRFTASEAGPRIFTFRIAPQPGEMVTQNNLRQVLVRVEDRREKILYFEGEPRFEVAFIRRAIAEDENLQVVLLQRTAENKFLRLDVDGPDDLLGGFPKTREDLFAYSGLILGSIEANYFTADQLRMIADFVNQRGGGFLMLGSHKSFAEGGYAGTPVADILPVLLDPDASSEEPDFVELVVRPTRSGISHATTQIAETEEASAERWRDVPAVSSLNPITAVKPGATTLLEGESDGGETRVVLAFQRYGRGKSVAFPIQDSWMWQMHADVPLDDPTHENYWRRLLRWLVDGVPDPVEATLTSDQVEPNEVVEVIGEVMDPSFLGLNNGEVVATVTAPSGELIDLPMDWTAERDGEYGTTLTPHEEGLYEVRVEASREGELVGSGVTYFRSAPSDSEYYDAAMRAPTLRRIAEDTGGRFYTRDTVATLPEDISLVGGGVTEVNERELWDMPILLLLLVGLMGGEWAYRRARGLP